MLEKKKTNKTKILCMLFLVTAIFAGSATAYAKTKTDTGKTIRGWTYKFVGEYVSSNGNAGINNTKIRVRHFVYSKKGTAGAGGHTIY